MVDQRKSTTREEAMAAIAEIGEYIDGVKPVNWPEEFMVRPDYFLTLLTLARAGAAVMFASEETVERVGIAFGFYAPDGKISDAAAEQVRAALAALSHQPEA